MASDLQIRSVPIVRGGAGQFICIPEEFALDGNEARITRDMRGRLIVEAAPVEWRRLVTEFLDSWEPLSDDNAMPEIEDLKVEPFDL